MSSLSVSHGSIHLCSFFHVPFYSIQRESSCLWTNVVSQHGPLYDLLSNFPFPFIRIHITRHHLCQDIHPPTSSLVRRSLQISDFLEVFLFLDVDVEFLDRRPVAVGEELVHGLVQVFLHSREAVVLVGVRLWGGEREGEPGVSSLVRLGVGFGWVCVGVIGTVWRKGEGDDVTVR